MMTVNGWLGEKIHATILFMNIAIIGGGFTGLSAAYELVKRGHRVTVFEKEKTLGGLAHGFKKKNWDWHLESAYHHLFTNDHAILTLIQELGLNDKLILTRPATANYMSSDQYKITRGGMNFLQIASRAIRHEDTKDPKQSTYSICTQYHDLRAADQKNIRSAESNDHLNIYPFDSPLHLLTYPGLSWFDKIRTGLLMAIMKLNPFWQPLEWISAKKLFVTIGGSAAWRLLWEPLMIGKFGKYAEYIAASWLWARIKKRTQKLYYIHGGFHTLVSALEKAIKHQGGIVRTGVTIHDIKKQHWKFKMRNLKFDKVLLTVPTPIAKKMVPHLTFDIGNLSLKIPHLHAQTLILETTAPILPILQDTLLQARKRVSCEANGVYWLNIMDRAFPFLAVVAHTNMIDAKHYGGHHITYFGNYLPSGHPYLSMTKKQLLNVFLPFINRLTPTTNYQLLTTHLFTAPFAQPVHELHYSRRAPRLATSIPGIYLANMDSIYPWDRGTNYAVELGQKAAKTLLD